MDPLCQDEDGYTPLHRACVGGDIDVVRYPVNETNKYIPLKDVVYDKTKHGRTLTHIAAFNGHLPVVKLFISELNCDPKTSGQLDRTPLHHAAHQGNLDVVKYLIEKVKCDPSYILFM